MTKKLTITADLTPAGDSSDSCFFYRQTKLNLDGASYDVTVVTEHPRNTPSLRLNTAPSVTAARDGSTYASPHKPNCLASLSYCL